MAPPEKTRHPLISYQPIRLIYRLIELTTTLAKLPFWLIRALVPALRPHPKWTFKQALMAFVVKAVLTSDSATAITVPLTLKPKREGDRWKVLEPFGDDLYTGPLRSELVQPGKTGGTWYPAFPPAFREDVATSSSPPPPRPSKVGLHFHGGAFVLYDGRDVNAGYLCTTLVREGGLDAVFSLQYRLSGHGGRDPFPAALQDVLTAYLYVVRTLGVPAADVTISGDSAGANLAAALLRYVAVFGEELGIPAPGRAVLISPWVAPLEAITVDYKNVPLYRTDYLPTEFVRWGARAYALQSDRYEDAVEYINPLGHPFRTPVPILVTMGNVEILCVQDAQWVEEMRAMEGNTVEVVIADGAPHDTMLIGDKVGWDASVIEVAGKIKGFVHGEH